MKEEIGKSGKSYTDTGTQQFECVADQNTRFLEVNVKYLASAASDKPSANYRAEIRRYRLS